MLAVARCRFILQLSKQSPSSVHTSCCLLHPSRLYTHTTTMAQQTQSLPAWTTTSSTTTAFKQPSLGSADSVASSQEETDCESDRGSGTPLRDHQSRLEAYMARKGMKASSAFRQRVARLQQQTLGVSPCGVHARPPLPITSGEQRSTTSPMVIPARTTAFQGWEDESDECRCGSECAFEQLTEEEEAELEGLGDLMFDLEI